MDWMLMPLRRYADFQGRSRRMEFWMWQVAMFLLGIVLQVVLMVVGGAALFATGLGSGGARPSEAGMAALGGGFLLAFGIAAIAWLALLVPSIAVSVRRLHDTNRSGFWLLAPIAPYALMVVGRAADSTALGLIGALGALALGIVLLVFYFLEGTPGENRFGADPKGRGDFDVFG